MIGKYKNRSTNLFYSIQFEPGERNRLFQNYGKDGIIHFQTDNNGIFFGIKIGENQIILNKNEVDKYLDNAIHEAQKRVKHIDRDLDGEYVNGNLVTPDIKKREALYKEREELIKQETEYTKARASADVEKTKAVAQLLNTEIEGLFKLAIIEKTRKEAEIKEKRDNHNSQLEADVYAIIKNYGFLDKPEEFKYLLEGNSKDAKKLENDLSALGMHLKVDGKIDENTVSAIAGLLLKNEAAIKKFKDDFGIDLVKKQGVEK